MARQPELAPWVLDGFAAVFREQAQSDDLLAVVVGFEDALLARLHEVEQADADGLHVQFSLGYYLRQQPERDFRITVNAIYPQWVKHRPGVRTATVWISSRRIALWHKRGGGTLGGEWPDAEKADPGALIEVLIEELIKGI